MVFLSKDHGEPFQPLTNRNPPQMQTLFKPNCGVSLPSAYSRASLSQSRQSLILLALADVAASASRADWTVRRVISNCAEQRCVQRHWQLCRAEVLSTYVQSYLQLCLCRVIDNYAEHKCMWSYWQRHSLPCHGLIVSVRHHDTPTDPVQPGTGRPIYTPSIEIASLDQHRKSVNLLS